MSRILIVDDEPNIVISLEYLLKREGYEVAIAADGEAALEAVARDRARPGDPRRDAAEAERLRRLPAAAGRPALGGRSRS